MKIFIFIILLLIPVNIFSQEINKDKLLNSTVTIELWTGEKIYGKVIKVEPNSITISKSGRILFFKQTEQTLLISDIKRIYDAHYKIVYEGKKLRNVIYIKRYKNLELILPCIFTGSAAVVQYFKYKDKMDAADEIEKIDIKLSEELTDEAGDNLLKGVLFTCATIGFYILSMQTEEIEIPISNLSLEIKSNKINLSYKF